MIGCGVFAGAKNAMLDVDSYPGTVSAIGSSPGVSGEGLSEATPSARRRPCSTWFHTEPAPGNMSCDSPLMTPIIEGPVPL